jgi:hypothetical protein
MRMHKKKMRSLQELKKSLTKCQRKDFVGVWKSEIGDLGYL